MSRYVPITACLAMAFLQHCSADEFSVFPPRPDHMPTDLTIANIFSDHMVLQQAKPLRIWGWAKPGNVVVIEFAGQSRSVSADKSGNWAVLLEPVPASFDARELRVSSAGHLKVIKDVLVGEVWLCGGQSNMEMKLAASRDADVELLSADYPAIRYVRLPLTSSLTPRADFPVDDANDKSPGHWLPCTTDHVSNCTAVGYYFARRLQRVLKTPIGVVDSSWGGTMAQHWITRETLQEIPQVAPYFKKHQTARDEWIAAGGAKGAKQRYQNDLQAWEIASAKIKKGEAPPRKPRIEAYSDPSLVARQPGGMMNGIIAPIAGLTVRGALFYQGENNCFGDWSPFPRTFPAVISDWRKAFDNTELPFGIIQISGWSTRRSMTYDMNHPTNIIREIQFKTWRQTPHTGLIVTFDTNSSRSIHPACKEPVGQRSARWALAEVYKLQNSRRQPLEWRGPVYSRMDVTGGKCVVHFEEATARGLVLDQDVDIGFYVAGEDKIFHHAKARVDERNRTLTVWSDAVTKPLAVRYGWSNLPAGGLVNARELPAYPFRSDAWPLESHADTEPYFAEKYFAEKSK
ncbi:MAG: hypothetical protein ABGX22_26645 [Pirellulaceae bacterium]